MRKVLIVLLATVVFGLFVSRDSFGNEDLFTFGSIPFGKSVNDVLGRIQSGSLREEKEDINLPGYKIFFNYFKGGVYSDFANRPVFDSSLVKKWIVNYDSNRWVGLYFSRNNNQHNLFLVLKAFYETSNVEETNFFSGLQSSITKKVGLAPTVHSTTYNTGGYGESDRKAMSAVWNLKDTRVFLMVCGYVGISYDILYLSLPVWNSYLKAIQGQADKEKRSGEKAGKHF